MRPIIYQAIYIFLLVGLVAIHDSVSVINKNNYVLLTKYPTNNKNAQCVKKVSEILFQSLTNLHLIVDNNLVHEDFYRKLSQFLSLSIENTTIFEPKKKRYIIIKDNLLDLKNLLERSSFSKWSEYLILINSSSEIISAFASYLYRNEFYYVAFLLIDENGDVTLNQLNSRLNKNHETDNHRNLIITAHCNDNFFINKNDQKSVRPFDRIICPRDGCSLSYWRMTQDAPVRVLYKSLENGSQVAVSLAAPMIQEFCDKFNIRITSKLNESSFNLSWTEAVNVMEKEKVNLLFGFTLPDSNFSDRIEASTYFMIEHLHIMDTYEYLESSTGLKRLFAPLCIEVWLSSILVLIFYGIFMFIVKNFHNQRLIREYLHPKYLINMFTKQDLLLPENGGLRIVVGMMLMFALVITSAYESAITSTYIAPNPSVKIETLEDLMISKFRFAGPKFIQPFFDDPTDRVMKYLYERYEIADTNEVVEMMYEDDVVMLHTSLAIQRVIWEERRKTHYYVSKEPFVYYPIIFFMRKGHPYVEALTKFVLQVIEVGMAHRWVHQFVRPHHGQVHVEESTPLDRYQMTSSLLLLLTGLATSLIVFLGELLFNKFLTGCKNSR